MVAKLQAWNDQRAPAGKHCARLVDAVPAQVWLEWLNLLPAGRAVRAALRGDGRCRQVALLPASILELATRSRGHAELRVGLERRDEPLEVVERQSQIRVELRDQLDRQRKRPQPLLKSEQVSPFAASLTQPFLATPGAQEYDPRVPLGKLSRNTRRAVAGAVVHDDPGAGPQRLGDDGRRQCGEILRFVTSGSDERIAAHRRGRRRRPYGLVRIEPEFRAHERSARQPKRVFSRRKSGTRNATFLVAAIAIPAAMALEDAATEASRDSIRPEYEPGPKGEMAVGLGSPRGLTERPVRVDASPAANDSSVMVDPRQDGRLRAAEHALRLGIAFAGHPDAPGAWSGIPASLANAMTGLGATVVPLNAGPSRPVESAATHLLALLRLHRTPATTPRERVRVSRTIARHTGPQLSALRTRALRRRLRNVASLDAVVQLGTEFGLPAGLRIATFEDMTVAQAVTLPYPEWQFLSKREQAARVQSQAAAYAQSVACCFTTPWAADSAINDYGVSPGKVHVVGVGRNHSPHPALRDWHAPRFLLVASDWERKNGDAVVRGFARLRQQHPTARLDLVGNHPRVGVEGVVGHGWLSLANDAERRKLDSLFETSTCFVMPSWCEPCGIAYVEAAAGGVPSIGSTVGGSTYLIGDAGCVVDPADEQGLLHAMLRLADGDTAREAGARALARAEHFTWPEVARRIVAALKLGPKEAGAFPSQ
jgi:glycosyltransferase involved in cell wall biosynthesis